MPAHSSATIKEGSFWPVSFTTRSEAHTASRVSASGAQTRAHGVSAQAVVRNPLTSKSQAAIPARLPQVPGAGLR